MQETLEVVRARVSDDPIDQLKKAVTTYDMELAERAASLAVEQGVDPLLALDAMTKAIRLIGDAFGAGELWLPDLVGASDAMSTATPIIEAEIERRGAERESVGSVVIGTVCGDIHSIGKTMVAALLAAEGFDVHDLGIDVTAEEFVDAVQENDANILAMSALLTTTAPQQRKVIQLLQEAGIRHRVKIMVGGGAITQQFAQDIGADGYDPTAPGAVRLARELVGK
ncbi:MAG: cobalamin-dependent protein [Anaerolineae bacterium]